MAKVEIEESELAMLQQVNRFADTALKNPKTRRRMLEIQKTLDPNAAIPEIDATDHVMTAVAGVMEKVEAISKRLDERDTTSTEKDRENDLRARVAAGQKSLRDAGYQADGVEKIERLMLERGISDYDAGLALFERINPPAAPADQSSSRWGGALDSNIDKSADYKDLWASQGQDDAWLDNSLKGTRWGRPN